MTAAKWKSVAMRHANGIARGVQKAQQAARQDGTSRAVILHRDGQVAIERLVSCDRDDVPAAVARGTAIEIARFPGPTADETIEAFWTDLDVSSIIAW